MRNDVIKLIKILGIGLTELVIDIPLDITTINSIEYDKNSDKIYIYIWTSDDLEIQIEFDDLSDKNKKIIHQSLSKIVNN